MSENSKQYDGDVLSLTIKRGGNGYQWALELSGSSHDGQTKLGYRAGGKLEGFKLGDFLIQVHDKDRPVWTAMPIDHRKDIRASMTALLMTAFKSLTSLGHHLNSN